MAFHRTPARASRRRPAEADHALEPYRERLAAIAALEPEIAALEDGALTERARALRRAAAGGTPDERHLAQAFALVREAGRRALGLRLYDVQIAGGLALHEGTVVEMATGEGKTLAAVAPVFLAALAGRGAHVLTFNDYLARRDAGWMGPIYQRLGLTVGFVEEGMTAHDRRRAYARDVTYLTAREAGFDYLRDGLCLEPGDRVQRAFHFALVDEADSILIDEARVPLVIAGAVESSDPGLARLAEVARRLEPEVDFATDDHDHNVFLTTAGSLRAEKLLGRGELYSAENVDLHAALRNALHAEHLLARDVDYIVRQGVVELVDEHTGRVAEKRQWPDGIHGAVEAKEGLRLGSDGRLLGSITLQHFLALYPRLAGMTATATAAAEELADLYGLTVEVVPPNRPCVRVDHEDLVFTHGRVRDEAVLDEIVGVQATGRPILVGTRSVAASERLAAGLERRGVDCRVLNAKNDEQEAAVVADAGALGAVTISTNMAGRGTDIRLGGGDERSAAEVAALGGLYVIGTNLHESRRIDRQLRGRAGRQGDPGTSRFFLSLEDDLPRRYGLRDLIPERLYPERMSTPIESRVVRRELVRAQRIVEGESFDVRRRLFEYSRILDEQRAFLRERRQAILEGSSPGSILDGEGTEPILDGEGAEPILKTRCPARWVELRELVGADRLAEIERRLALLVIDCAWGRYLTDMQTTRDEVHLVTLDGRQPLAEFYRAAIAGFGELRARIDDDLVAAFESLPVSAAGVDWQASGLRAPAATWTYLVTDHVFGGNVMGALANRASIGLWGSLLLWWLLIPWGIYLHWKRRRTQAGLDG